MTEPLDASSFPVEFLAHTFQDVPVEFLAYDGPPEPPDFALPLGQRDGPVYFRWYHFREFSVGFEVNDQDRIVPGRPTMWCEHQRRGSFPCESFPSAHEDSKMRDALRDLIARSTT